MHFDFEVILFLATLVSGVIWAIDHWFFLPGRRAAIEAAGEAPAGKPAKLKAQSQESTLVEYARSFFPVLLIVFLLRSFLIEPFKIPSGSMMPTLLTGDFILVNKLAYGVRLPVVHSKIFGDGVPKRGDVTVFRYPVDPTTDYIKRIVGLPGDRIDYRNKVLYVNGEPQPRKANGVFFGEGSAAQFTGAQRGIETLGDVEHSMMIDPRKPNINAQCRVLSGGPVVVPEGQYFAMGDNRDASADSRCWGFVPDENLVGRAFFIWMHFDGRRDGWFGWDRIGDSIK